MRGEEGGESGEMAVEPSLEGEPGQKLRGGRADQVAQKWGEGVPVSQGPIRRRHWWGEDRMRNSNGDGNVVRAGRGQGGAPVMAEGSQPGGRKG